MGLWLVGGGGEGRKMPEEGFRSAHHSITAPGLRRSKLGGVLG